MRADARANRDRILTAAEDLFARHGWAASTEEVARRAGVGPGTVFRHFPSKRALLEAATIRHFEEATAAVDHGTEADDPADAFTAAFTLLVSDASSKTALIGLLTEDGEPGAAVQEASRVLRAATERRLERAQEVGAVRADVDIAAVYVLIRALAAAAAMPGVEDAALATAIEVTLDGLRCG